MKSSKNIVKLSLFGVLCALNLLVFSQDTIAQIEVEEPLKNSAALRLDAPSATTAEPPKNVEFRMPGQKNPKLAGWLSVAIPGAGQVYNGQWWKVPIIYGGAGTLYYFGKMNKTERDLFQKEYRGRLNFASGLDTNFIRNPQLASWSDDQVLNARNYYRRNLELIYILSGVLYILNIVDAVVFAHLATFDVSDNLTMRVQPFAAPDLSYHAQNQRIAMQGGLRLTFTLK